MRIAIAGGHSSAARGACGYIDEYDCDRAFVARLIPALEDAGHDVVDCSNEQPTVMGELKEEVAAANASGADVFLAVHFNAGGGTGTECYYYSTNSDGRDLAAALSANVASALGLRDRGAKTGDSLYVVRRTNPTAVLLEVCFVDTWADAEAWHDTPWDSLCDAVVAAFAGHTFGCGNTSETDSEPVSGGGLAVDGYFGSATVSALQAALGTTVDGVVSGQDYRDMAAIGGKPTGAWQIGAGGSQMVRALQEKLGVDSDGYFGRDTCRALQSHLGTTVDGVLSKPSACVKELQRRLNAGTL